MATGRKKGKSKEVVIEGQPAQSFERATLTEGLVESLAIEHEIDTDYSKQAVGVPKPVSATEELEARFTYHPPRGNQSARYVVIRAIAKELGRAITRWCPPSRERELALTALDTVVMWANAAIARRET